MENSHTNSSAACPVSSGSTGFFVGDKPPAGADRGDIGSESSRKGFVERGRAGLIPGLWRELVDGDDALFRKGLFEPSGMDNWGEARRSGQEHFTLACK